MTSPFISAPMIVEPQWIDHNGHLNMAYYNVLFDHGVDQLWEKFGFGPDYVATRKMTTFAAESHIRYLRELHQGDYVTCSLQLLDHDRKRFHFYQELIHTDGWLSATAEGLTLHIDITGPRVAPMPDDVYARVTELAAQHATLPRPAAIGQPIGIRRK